MECYESLVNLPATCSASDAEKHSPTLTLLGHSVMQDRNMGVVGREVGAQSNQYQ